jgi:hypothetical protein
MPRNDDVSLFVSVRTRCYSIGVFRTPQQRWRGWRDEQRASIFFPIHSFCVSFRTERVNDKPPLNRLLGVAIPLQTRSGFFNYLVYRPNRTYPDHLRSAEQKRTP